MDHDDDVLYCYEIQTEQKMRRKGLGEQNNDTQLLSRLNSHGPFVAPKIRAVIKIRSKSEICSESTTGGG